MDKSLLYGLVAMIFYMILDYIKYYFSKSKNEYEISTVIPYAIAVFVCVILVLNIDFQTGSTNIYQPILNEPFIEK